MMRKVVMKSKEKWSREMPRRQASFVYSEQMRRHTLRAGQAGSVTHHLEVHAWHLYLKIG